MVVKAPAAKRSLKRADEQADERLLVEAAQKDPTRFAELYEINFHLVYAYIARRVGDRDVAQDLTADVFHKALANLPRFEWRGAPFGAWLLRIAANAVADRSKRAGREVANLDDPDELSASGVNAPAGSDLAGAEFEKTQQRAQLFLLVEQLPADQRHVVTMRFAEEKSIREIAQHLKRSEGAIKQLQFRAITKLRSQLGGAYA
jgi:RNA polymerase sigma-70 factor (ECF subfamily)